MSERRLCPLCGETMEEARLGENIADAKGRRIAMAHCEECGLAVTAPTCLFGDVMASMRPKGVPAPEGSPVEIQSFQRVAQEDGSVQLQAIVTSEGIVREALVDLDKVSRTWPGRSPLGLLDDELRIFVARDAAGRDGE